MTFTVIWAMLGQDRVDLTFGVVEKDARLFPKMVL